MYLEVGFCEFYYFKRAVAGLGLSTRRCYHILGRGLPSTNQQIMVEQFQKVRQGNSTSRHSPTKYAHGVMEMIKHRIGSEIQAHQICVLVAYSQTVPVYRAVMKIGIRIRFVNYQTVIGVRLIQDTGLGLKILSLRIHLVYSKRNKQPVEYRINSIGLSRPIKLGPIQQWSKNERFVLVLLMMSDSFCFVNESYFLPPRV